MTFKLWDSSEPDPTDFRSGTNGIRLKSNRTEELFLIKFSLITNNFLCSLFHLSNITVEFIVDLLIVIRAKKAVT